MYTWTSQPILCPCCTLSLGRMQGACGLHAYSVSGLVRHQSSSCRDIYIPLLVCPCVYVTLAGISRIHAHSALSVHPVHLSSFSCSHMTLNKHGVLKEAGFLVSHTSPHVSPHESICVYVHTHAFFSLIFIILSVCVSLSLSLMHDEQMKMR